MTITYSCTFRKQDTVRDRECTILIYESLALCRDVGVMEPYVESDESNFNVAAGNIMHSNVTCYVT